MQKLQVYINLRIDKKLEADACTQPTSSPSLAITSSHLLPPLVQAGERLLFPQFLEYALHCGCPLLIGFQLLIKLHTSRCLIPLSHYENRWILMEAFGYRLWHVPYLLASHLKREAGSLGRACKEINLN